VTTHLRFALDVLQEALWRLTLLAAAGAPCRRAAAGGVLDARRWCVARLLTYIAVRIEGLLARARRRSPTSKAPLERNPRGSGAQFRCRHTA
jgi:hypothetical protein